MHGDALFSLVFPMNYIQCTFVLERASSAHVLLFVLMFGGALFFFGCAAEQKKTVPLIEFNLYGKTLGDDDFDWQSLRGKYVLVKFTATWCLPCKAEIPGMLEAYEKYRDKGFEIVSVYIFEKSNEEIKQFASQEKLPWIILSEPLTVQAGQPPQGRVFGIEGVPTMLIVNREGNIHAVHTQGSYLKQELEKLFGE